MAPPFWLHCNVCGGEYSKLRKIVLANCSHLICKDCLSRAKDQGATCPVCQATGIKYTDLSKLPDDIKSYFHPNITQNLYTPRSMVIFQTKHFKSLIKTTKIKIQKKRKLQKIKAQLQKQLQKSHEAFMKARERRKKMQAKLFEIYKQKQKQKREQMYRDRVMSSSSFLSSASTSGQGSSASPSSICSGPNFNLTVNSTISNGSDFFKPKTSFFNPPARSIYKAGSDTPLTGNSSFGSKSTQSNRKPMFT